MFKADHFSWYYTNKTGEARPEVNRSEVYQGPAGTLLTSCMKRGSSWRCKTTKSFRTTPIFFYKNVNKRQISSFVLPHSTGWEQHIKSTTNNLFWGFCRSLSKRHRVISRHRPQNTLITAGPRSRDVSTVKWSCAMLQPNNTTAGR